METHIDPEARVVFFSDAHLESEAGEESQQRQERVCDFLEQVAGPAQVLVILGDLFDFYFEYRTVLPARHFRVMAALERLSRAGVGCYYIAGNHDFWLGDLFSRTLGIRVIHDSLILARDSAQAERVFAAHGDGLGEGDTGYKVIKKILRNRALIRLFRAIHPDWGYALARLTSRTSRKYTAGLQPSRVEAAAATAGSLLESHPELDTVILAHTHQPDRRQFGRGLYLNCGDWCEHSSYIVWTPGKFELKNFDPAS